MAAMETFAHSFLGPAECSWEDTKLYAGLGIWAAVWCYYFQGPGLREEKVAQFHLTAFLVLGADLAVLAMLQAMGSVGVLGLFALCAVNVYLSSWLFTRHEPVAREGFTANSIYEDLEMNIVQVAWIFVGQTVLTAFLLCSAYHNYEEKSKSLTYSFWLAAYVSVQMSGFFKRSRDSQLGSTWNLQKWHDLVNHNSGAYTRQVTDFQRGSRNWMGFLVSKFHDLLEHSGTYRLAGRGEALEVTDFQMRSRDWMGFLVNTFYRDIIAYLTPVLLMQADDPMDFVQNSFAVCFITLLDDMGEGKDFEAVRYEPPEQERAAE